MAEKAVAVGIRLDPDFKDLVGNVFDAIRDAYDRGAISWQQRCELLEEPTAAFCTKIYTVPTAEGEPPLCGVFLDLLPELLA